MEVTSRCYFGGKLCFLSVPVISVFCLENIVLCLGKVFFGDVWWRFASVRSSCQRHLQHLHQQLWIHHWNNHGESVLCSSLFRFKCEVHTSKSLKFNLLHCEINICFILAQKETSYFNEAYKVGYVKKKSNIFASLKERQFTIVLFCSFRFFTLFFLGLAKFDAVCGPTYCKIIIKCE